MSKAEAKKIAKEYAQALQEAGFPVKALYLFGSQLKKGEADEESDIDIAVVSDRLKHQRHQDRLLLWKVRRGIDTRIEPHGFTSEDFKIDEDPMVYEIKKTGVRVM